MFTRILLAPVQLFVAAVRQQLPLDVELLVLHLLRLQVLRREDALRHDVRQAVRGQLQGPLGRGLGLVLGEERGGLSALHGAVEHAQLARVAHQAAPVVGGEHLLQLLRAQILLDAVAAEGVRALLPVRLHLAAQQQLTSLSTPIADFAQISIIVK